MLKEGLRQFEACVIISQMEINVLLDEGFKKALDKAWLRNVAQEVLKAEGQSNVEMGILITGDERIKQLNKEYLDEDKPTDVLSFAMMESAKGDTTSFPTPPDGTKHLGEVIISYPQAVKQAEEHKHSAKKEGAVLLIHGVLHLLGYDHDVPETQKRMEARETELVLRRLD